MKFAFKFFVVFILAAFIWIGESQSEPKSEQMILAGTNVTKHSVPLENVYFDMFNGSTIPLSRITESVVLRLRDAIPPLTNPAYTDVNAADKWLKADDLILGYVDGNEAYGYPVRILNFHEIVNETVKDVPILISYCPLCGSAIVYDRRLKDRVLEFGNTSALYESDLVMYDKETKSYWFQVGGEAIVGDLTGERLNLLSAQHMIWKEWRKTYPDSRILARNTRFKNIYDRDPFVGLPGLLNRGFFSFPVSDAARNKSLPAGEKVLGIVIDDEARAYPVAGLTGSAVNDNIAGLPVAIVVNEAGTARAFERTVGKKILTLTWIGNKLIDKQTESNWSFEGEAVSGKLKGKKLRLIPARFSYWFSFVTAFPHATAYKEPKP